MNMMRMLASRQNAKWVEAQEWDVPYTFDATKFPTLLGMYATAPLQCNVPHADAKTKWPTAAFVPVQSPLTAATVLGVSRPA